MFTMCILGTPPNLKFLNAQVMFWNDWMGGADDKGRSAHGIRR